MAILMLRICRLSVGSGEDLILDSVFCVDKGITELKSKVVFAGAMIKEQRYWPKRFPVTFLILTLNIRRLVMLE